MLPRDPRKLAAEAEQVLEDCENILESVSRLIQEMPTERDEILTVIESMRDEHRRAWARSNHVWEHDLSRWEEDVAEEEVERVRRRLDRQTAYLNSDRFDLEYRRAVARQVAGLVRESHTRKLDEIAARSADSQLRQTVSECKDGVTRSTRYIINRYYTPVKMTNEEIRKARTEAQAFLDESSDPR